MSSSNRFLSHQRNNAQHRKANAGPSLKRRFDNRRCDGDFKEEMRNRYAPPQKRPRCQFQSQSQSRPPLYHGSNMSRVSNSYYGNDVIHSNSSNFGLRNNAYGNPNPQFVPLPLPYRKLDDFDSLPEWPLHLTNNVTGVGFNTQPPVFPNMSQPMPPQQPIVTKDLSDLLTVLNNEKEKHIDEPTLGLSFESVKLNVRHESAIRIVYSDLPRQCTSCGVRFKLQEDHSKHMDWHVRKNRMAKEATTSRANSRLSQKPSKSQLWFSPLSLWLTGGTTEAAKPFFKENGETKVEEQRQRSVVPADENQTLCALCEEPFEDFFCDDADDWMYKDAVYLNTKALGPIVHAKCMPETRKVPSTQAKITSLPVPSALVC